jgi:hypothetical protein
MAEPKAPDDPLAAAQTLLALTEALVLSLEDEAGDPTAILEQRSALLALPFEARPDDPNTREHLETVRARVEALEQTALTLLTRRITETRVALTAVEAGRTATLSYLEEPALPPLLLDRHE